MKNIQIEGKLAENIKNSSARFNIFKKFLLNLIENATAVGVTALLYPTWWFAGFEKLAIAAIMLSVGMTYIQKKDVEKKKKIARAFLRNFTMQLEEENIYIKPDALEHVKVQEETYYSYIYGDEIEVQTQCGLICCLDSNGEPQLLEELT